MLRCQATNKSSPKEIGNDTCTIKHTCRFRDYQHKSKLEYKHPPMSRTESCQIDRYHSVIFVERWHVQTTELKNVLVMYLCNEKEKVSSRFDPDKSYWGEVVPERWSNSQNAKVKSWPATWIRLVSLHWCLKTHTQTTSHKLITCHMYSIFSWYILK